MLPPLIMLFILYQFMIVRPQRTRQRAHDEMLKNLKNGDKIITTGGIYGTVTDIGDKDVVQVRIADSVKINLSRSAIAALQEIKKETSKESEKK
ncbi:MAG: preprotein translocase subunit YajC [Acidobacteriota bacterium]